MTRLRDLPLHFLILPFAFCLPLAPRNKNRRRDHTTDQMITRVDHPDLCRFPFPDVHDRQRRDGESCRETGTKFESGLQVHDPHSPEETGDRRRGHEITDKLRDQHSRKLTFRRLPARGTVTASMPQLFRSPNLAEEQRVPDKAQEKIGDTRAKNS